MNPVNGYMLKGVKWGRWPSKSHGFFLIINYFFFQESPLKWQDSPLNYNKEPLHEWPRNTLWSTNIPLCRILAPVTDKRNFDKISSITTRVAAIFIERALTRKVWTCNYWGGWHNCFDKLLNGGHFYEVNNCRTSFVGCICKGIFKSVQQVKRCDDQKLRGKDT